MNLKYMKVSLFEITYKKKWTFSRHSNLLRCTCMHNNRQTRNALEMLNTLKTPQGSMIKSKLQSVHRFFPDLPLTLCFCKKNATCGDSIIKQFTLPAECCWQITTLKLHHARGRVLIKLPKHKTHLWCLIVWQEVRMVCHSFNSARQCQNYWDGQSNQRLYSYR